jgi:hypothetical protein
MEKEKKKPKAEFKVGSLKVTVWENSGKTVEGKAYSFDKFVMKKIYKEGENWKETDNLGKEDVLLASQLLLIAYNKLYFREGN